MSANAEWNDIENSKIQGVLPDYRVLVNNGTILKTAATQLAQFLLNNDPHDFFKYRKPPHVKHSVDTVAQHIIFMDDIVAGTVSPKTDSEKRFFGIYPR